MDDTLWLLAHIAVSLLLVALTVVATLAIVGPRLRRHAVWLERLDLRVGNLHKDREERYARSLQVPREEVDPMLSARPPTLSLASTVEVSPDLLKTLTAKTRPPPSGPE